MSYTFFSSDHHFGSANILKYCNRPWLQPGDLTADDKWVSLEIADQRALEMGIGLREKWNQKVKPDDTTYIVGDFILRGSLRHAAGGPRKAAEWAATLNGHKVFILGNHDDNNGLSRGLQYAVMEAGATDRLLLIHNPRDAMKLALDCNIVVCGHVHTAWHTSVDRFMGRVYVNVGVDMNKYAPVRLDEVLGIAHKVLREKGGDGKHG